MMPVVQMTNLQPLVNALFAQQGTPALKEVLKREHSPPKRTVSPGTTVQLELFMTDSILAQEEPIRLQLA